MNYEEKNVKWIMFQVAASLPYCAVTVGARNMREKSPKSRQASAQADVL